MESDRIYNHTNFYNLLIDIEEESTELLTSLGELEIGAGLEPDVVSDGADDWIVGVSRWRNGSEVVWHFLDVTLDGLEGDVALVSLVIGVLLEAKNEPLINIPTDLSLLNSIYLQLNKGGDKLSGGNGANSG